MSWIESKKFYNQSFLPGKASLRRGRLDMIKQGKAEGASTRKEWIVEDDG